MEYPAGMQFKDCGFVLCETRPSELPERKSLKATRFDPPAESPEGIPLFYGGLIRGYLATFDVDSGDDEFVPGCFKESIEKFFHEHTRRFGGPYMKGLSQHYILTSVFNYMEETEKGLYVEKTCLNTTQGRDYFVEVTARAINQMSIGFIPLETRMKVDANGKPVIGPGGSQIRQILKAEIMEGSGVWWPMNYATSLGKSIWKMSDPSARVPSDNSMEVKSMELGDCAKELIKGCVKAIIDGKSITPSDYRILRTCGSLLYEVTWLLPYASEDDKSDDLEFMALREEIIAKHFGVTPPVAKSSGKPAQPEVTPVTKSDPHLGSLMNSLSAALAGIEQIPVSGKE